MDQKTKTLFVLVVVALLASVALTYYKTVVQKDFEVVNLDLLLEEE